MATLVKTSNLSDSAVTHAKLHTAMDLTGKTVTVAAPSSNAHPATKLYVDTEVANLIDSAPGALNTLNELAAAINDDANYQATVATSLATKLPLAGGTMTGALNMGSNNITTTGKILFANVYATEGDLPSASTYHGMFAHVHATGKGYYAHAGNWVQLANAGATGGGYEDADTAAYLATSQNKTINTSAGNVGIGVASPGAKLALSGPAALVNLGGGSTASSALYVNSTSGHTGELIQVLKNSTTKMHMANDGKLGIGTSSPQQLLHVYNASSGVVARIEGPNAYNSESGLEFSLGRARISGVINGSHGTPGAALKFMTMPNGGSITSRMVIDSSGNVGIATTAPQFKLHVNKGTGNYAPTNGVVENIAAFQTNYDAAGSQILTYANLDGNWVDGTSGANSASGLVWGYQNLVRGGLVYDHRGSERFQLWSSYGAITFMTSDAADTNAVPTDANIKDRLTISAGGNIALGVGSDLSLDSNLGANATTAFTSMDGRIFFSNDYSNTPLGANKIVLQNDGNWNSGLGISNNSLDIYTGGDINFHKSNSTSSWTRNITIKADGKLGLGISSPLTIIMAQETGGNLTSGNAIKSSTMKGLTLNAQEGAAHLNSLGVWFGSNGSHWSGIAGGRSNLSTWGTDLRFYTHEDNTADLAYSRERMVITESGNVGIGIQVPTAKLDVRGVFNSQDNASSTVTGASSTVYNLTNRSKISGKINIPIEVFFANGTSNLCIRLYYTVNSLWLGGEVLMGATYSSAGAQGFRRYSFGHNQNGSNNYGNYLSNTENMGVTNSHFSFHDHGWDSSENAHYFEFRHLQSSGNTLWIQFQGHGSAPSTAFSGNWYYKHKTF